LPTGDRGREVACAWFVPRVERFADQQIVEIPTTLLLSAESPGQLIAKLGVLRGSFSESSCELSKTMRCEPVRLLVASRHGCSGLKRR
jgi:hypothetical protein